MRTVFFVVIAALALAACGEREQVTEFKRGKYQGKPDTQPWANSPVVAELRGGTWKAGDRTSWEDSIKSRQLAQHEHKRIYQ